MTRPAFLLTVALLLSACNSPATEPPTPPVTAPPAPARPAANDDVATTPRYMPVVISVLANDTVQGPAKIQIFTSTGGSASVIGNQVRYQPDPFSVGEQRIVYRLCDERQACANAQVVVNVTNRGQDLSGILSTDTVFRAENGPYFISATTPLQIARGVRVTFEAGSEIVGVHDSRIQSAGRLTFTGTAKAPVRLHGLTVTPLTNDMDANMALTVQHAHLEDSAIFPYGSFGAVNVTDSTFIGGELTATSFIGAGPYPVNLTRNDFSRTVLSISVGRASAGLNMRHNLVGRFNVSGFAADFTIKSNSFVLLDDPRALNTAGNYQTTAIDLSGNYWGSTDVALIRRRIWDREDDLNNYATVTIEPVLAAPDPLTPVLQ